jgi:hypothetical protein
MSDKVASGKIVIEIKKRTWYEWVLWALWFLVELYVVQNAIASAQEYEPRAATIFWVTFVVLLIGGAVVWFMRRSK